MTRTQPCIGLTGLLCTSLLAALVLQPQPQAAGAPVLPFSAQPWPAAPRAKTAELAALEFAPNPRSGPESTERSYATQEIFTVAAHDALFDLEPALTAVPADLRRVLQERGDEQLVRLRFRLEREIERIQSPPEAVVPVWREAEHLRLMQQQLLVDLIAERTDFGRGLRGPYSFENDTEEEYGRRYARAEGEDCAVHGARVRAERVRVETQVFDQLFADGKYKVVPESSFGT